MRAQGRSHWRGPLRALQVTRSCWLRQIISQAVAPLSGGMVLSL